MNRRTPKGDLVPKLDDYETHLVTSAVDNALRAYMQRRPSATPEQCAAIGERAAKQYLAGLLAAKKVTA